MEADDNVAGFVLEIGDPNVLIAWGWVVEVIVLVNVVGAPKLKLGADDIGVCVVGVLNVYGFRTAFELVSGTRGFEVDVVNVKLFVADETVDGGPDRFNVLVVGVVVKVFVGFVKPKLNPPTVGFEVEVFES